MANLDNMYFWLGADGEVEEVTEEQFELNIENTRRDRERWANVEVDGGSTFADGGTRV